MAEIAENNSDRISNLPDAIIHHIFSFLPMNYMLPLRRVSKRYNHLCLSSPHLKFASVQGLNRYLASRKTFHQFVEKCTKSSSGIHSLYISVVVYGQSNYDRERSRVRRWIQKAANSYVQELKLELKLVDWDPNHFNAIEETIPTLFHCTSLRILEICFHQEMTARSVEFPLVVVSSLEVLTLQSVSYGGPIPISEWISYYCPSLKNLNLDCVRFLDSEPQPMKFTHHVLEEVKIVQNCVSTTVWRTISISCNNLRAFSIVEDDVSIANIQISAPNLQVMGWTGYCVPCVEFANICCVTDATVNIKPYSDEVFPDQLNHGAFINRPHHSEKVLPDQLIELLRLFTCAKVIHLSIKVIESLFIYDHLPMLFDNVKHMEIVFEKSLHDYHIKVIEDIIKRMPNLETLTIGLLYGLCRPKWDREVAEKIEKLEAPQNSEVLLRSLLLFPKLKEVKIEFGRLPVRYTDSDTKLVKYFLETMDSLEMMTIVQTYANTDSFLAVTAFLANHPTIASEKLVINCWSKDKALPATSTQRCFEF